MSSLLSSYNTNAMSSDGMINDLKTKRNNSLTSAYNTLNQELQAKYSNLESMGGDIEKVAGVVAGGITTAKGIRDSIKKVYKKFKKKTGDDDEDEEDEEGDDDGDVGEEGGGEDMGDMEDMGDIDDLGEGFKGTQVEGFDPANIAEGAETKVSDLTDGLQNAGEDAVEGLQEGAENVASRVGGFVSQRAGNLISSARSAITSGARNGKTLINNLVRNVKQNLSDKIKSATEPKEATDPYNEEGNPDEGIEMETFRSNQPIEEAPVGQEVEGDIADPIKNIANASSKAEDAVENAGGVGEDIGETAGETAGEIAGEVGETAGEIAGATAGEVAGEIGLETAGTALDATGIGAIIGVPLQILGGIGLIGSVAGGIAMASSAGEKLQEGLKDNAENLQHQKQQAVNVAGKFSVPSFSSVNAFNN